MVKIAVLNTLVFILGITLGYTFAAKQNASPPAPVITDTNSDADPDAQTPAAADGSKDRLKTPKTDAQPGGEKTALAKVIAGMPKPETIAGDGVITGTVYLPDDRPLEGVLIRATHKPPRSERRHFVTFGGTPDDPPIENLVTDLIKKVQSQRLARKEALTNQEGKFTLSGLADGHYQLSAYLAGYKLIPKQGRSYYHIKPGDTAEYTALAVITLQVNVVLPNGSSPDKAIIEYMEPQSGRGGGPYSMHWHRSNPVIQLLPGRYNLKAICNEGDEYTSEAQNLTLKAGDTPAPMTFQLKGRSGLKGKVVFEEEGEVYRVNVTMVRIPPDSAPDLNLLKQPDKDEWIGWYNEYAFHFKDLAPGAYLVGASLSYRGEVLVAHVVDVADSTVTQDLVVPPMDPQDYVVVWVLDPDGKPMQSVNISAGFHSDVHSSARGQMIGRQKDGSFRVLHHGPPVNSDTDLETITYILYVHSRQFGNKEVTYERKDRSEVIVQFTQPAFLTVQVDNYVGSGHEGRVSLSLNRVSKYSDKESSRHQRDRSTGKPDAKGLQTFGPVAPGEYEIRLHVKSRQYGTIMSDQVDLSLSPGDNNVTLSLPPLYSLVVHVEDPQPNTDIQVRPTPPQDGWWGRIQKVAEDGRCEFHQLPPGDYKVLMYDKRSRSGNEMLITIRGDMDISYEPKNLNALTVYLRHDDGYLARAGLQSGDIIIGVKGKAFTEMGPLYSALFSSEDQEPLQIQVLRDGQPLDITVDAKKLQAQRRLGVNFEPTAR